MISPNPSNNLILDKDQRRQKLIKETAELIAYFNTEMRNITLSDKNVSPTNTTDLNMQSYSPESEIYRNLTNQQILNRQQKQEIQIFLVKNYNQSTRDRIQYEKKRLLDDQDNEKLYEIMQQKQKHLFESRQIKITSTNLNVPNDLSNMQIQDYSCFIVQEFSQWLDQKNNVTNQINQIKREITAKLKDRSFFGGLFSPPPKPDIFALQLERQIQQLVEVSLLLIQNWHFENNPFRIICVHRQKELEKVNFYIYHKEHEPSTKISISPLDKASAESLRQKFISTHFVAKYRDSINIISKGYLERTKANLSQMIIFNNVGSKIVSSPQLVSLKSQNKIYTEYPKQSLTHFIKSWKDKAYFYEKNSRSYIYIQPTHIYIPKTDLAKTVTLTTDSSIRQNFHFAGQNAQYFIFQSDRKQTYSYDIDRLPKREILFNAEIVDTYNKRNTYSNRLNISNIENQALGFSYELGLLPDQNVNASRLSQNNFSYILLFQAAVKKGSSVQTPKNLTLFRDANLLSKIGKIPNIYSFYYEYNYTPQIHPLVSQILSGTPTDVNKKNFEAAYLQYVNFCQSEQNKSQNYCQNLKLNASKRNNASGFVMRDRYTMYTQYLKLAIEQIKADGSEIFQKNEIEVSKELIKRQLANLSDDIKQAKLYNREKVYAVLQKFIIYHYYILVKRKRNPENLLVSYNISMLKIADYIIQIYYRNSNNQISRSTYSNFNINELSLFFIAFMQILYPYHAISNVLKEDLTHIRIIAQKYIPQFNYLLNRKGIGLQNYASQFLLGLFTPLPMELCYRIWDYLIINNQKPTEARLISLYTIMLFQQKADMIPIFPINTIIDSIHINSFKVKLDNTTLYNTRKVIKNYFEPSYQRQLNIIELAKEKYLRRFAFGRNTKQSNVFDEDKIERALVGDAENNINLGYSMNTAVVSTPNKGAGLKDISYPLPTPGYGGYRVDKVYLFIGGVFFLGNFNFHSKGYRLQVNLAGGSEIKDQLITDKSSFINKFIEFDIFESASGASIMNKVGIVVEFRLIESPNLQIMSAKLKLDGYHKNVVYRENVNLMRSKKIQDRELTNMVSSVLNLALIVKSANHGQIQRVNWQQLNKKQVQISQKLLDHDLSPANNQVVKAMSKLDKLLSKIIDPLDQLDAEKIQNLKVSTSFRSREPQWIHNSKVSIEELRAIFGLIFSEESEKSIKLNFPKFYQSYSENYQKFQLGEFLLDLILMAPISKLKKLSMIFCICIHYQNIFQGNTNLTQKMSIETLNSVIHSIMKSTGYINACPFSNKYLGKIIYGCYYEKGNKVLENKNQITQILRDWLYICQLNSNYSGVILGTAKNLSILRAMFPSNILKKIQQEALCRFQIHYLVGQEIYVWAATVNTSDFTVAKRGVKFLNNYPKYAENEQYLTSAAEILYNCQNLIPLQSHRPIDYQQFLNIFKQSPLLDFLLTQNEPLTASVESKDRIQTIFYQTGRQIPEPVPSNSDGNEVQKVKQEQLYTDFAIYRHQNCTPSWKRCKVIRDDGKVQVLVQFKDKQGQYLIPKQEVICMDESISNNQDIGELSESSLAEYKRNAY